MPFSEEEKRSLLSQKGIGATCWRNSPQARKAIETAVNWAKDWSQK